MAEAEQAAEILGGGAYDFDMGAAVLDPVDGEFEDAVAEALGQNQALTFLTGKIVAPLRRRSSRNTARRLSPAGCWR